MRAIFKRKRCDFEGYLFVLPAFILFLTFAAVPAILTFRISFFEWDFLSPDMKFVGLENFKKIFEDDDFKMVMGNTAYFTIISVLLKVGLGVILANFVAKRLKNKVGQFMMETALFMPIVIPMSVVALVFNKLYDTEFGYLNGIIHMLGGAPIGWLSDPDIALNSIIVVDIFKGVGFFFIISLVAIRNIPKTYYEAAEIDGGSQFRQFINITLPQMGNTLVYLLITAFISSFQVFDAIYIMLNGMFGDTKITISYMMWQQAFFYRDVGYASVISIVIFIIVLLITLVQFLLSRMVVKNDDY